MKLGVLVAGRRPDDIVQRMDQAREAGFSLCQLNLMQSGFNRNDLVAIADSMLEYGVRPLAIGCYVNPMRPDDSSLMGANRADLDTLLHTLDIIGARRVVLWSGTHADALFDEHTENSAESSLGGLREFLTDIVRNTRARHYSLVVEPWKTHVLSSAEKVTDFHASLPPAVAERVRYVLDATNLITAEQYAERDLHVSAACEAVGRMGGVVHLKDIIMPPDGDDSLAGPGQGRLDYPAYVAAILKNAPPDAPAIVKNVPPSEFGSVRDYLLRLSDRWELA